MEGAAAHSGGGDDDHVYALLGAWNAHRHAALGAAKLSSSEFETLRQEIYAQLFSSSSEHNYQDMEYLSGIEGYDHLNRGGSRDALLMAATIPTPNASTVHGDGDTAAPSVGPSTLLNLDTACAAATLRFNSDDGRAGMGGLLLQGERHHLEADRSMPSTLQCLKDAVIMAHLPPTDLEFDIEELFAAYCGDKEQG